MIRKYHNHKLQAKPWHHEEEPQDILQLQDIQKTTKAKQPALFLVKVIAKLERT